MHWPDAQQFKEAMVKEVNDHSNRKQGRVMLKKDVPKDEIDHEVQAMHVCMRGLQVESMSQPAGGHKTIPSKHFDETCAPVLSWTTIWLFLCLCQKHRWKSRQVDFALAHPHTCMELPQGVNFPGLDQNKHCLQVLKNVCGGKDSRRTWCPHLKSGLKSINFVKSDHDDCVFCQGLTVPLACADNCIFTDKESDANIDKCIKDPQSVFDVEDEGTLEDYLGAQITKHEDGTMTFTQPQLIDSILKDSGLINEDGTPRPNAKTRDTPVLSSRLISLDPDGEPFNCEWDYHSLIGKLNFLEKSSRCDMAHATHQCTRFMSSPKQSHGEAVKKIGCYLLKTRDKGLIIKRPPCPS